MQQTELLVCVKCRRGQEIPADDRRPGQALYEAVTARDIPPEIRVTPVECLQNCDAGCTVAMRGGPDKWTYVYGALNEAEDAALLLDGARLYHAAETGLIPWRARPDHFKRNCVARIPPATPTATTPESPE